MSDEYDFVEENEMRDMLADDLADKEARMVELETALRGMVEWAEGKRPDQSWKVLREALRVLEAKP